jgi:RNA polymerase sigma factor (sigma-70 family)
MRRKPSLEIFVKIQWALEGRGVILDYEAAFPDGFKPFKRGLGLVQTRDVSVAELENFRQNYVALLEDAQADDPACALMRKEDAEEFERSKGGLDDRTRAIMRMRRAGETLDEIGKRYGITRERVRQIVKEGCYKFRHHLQFKEDTKMEMKPIEA